MYGSANYQNVTAFAAAGAYSSWAPVGQWNNSGYSGQWGSSNNMLNALFCNPCCSGGGQSSWNPGYSCGGGSGAGAYLGGAVAYSRTPIYQDRCWTEAHYQTVHTQQACTQNEPGKMWDVWFDYKDGQKTTQKSPIVLDLNGNGKPDITGKNVLGDGKVEGEGVMFDIDPSKESWEYKSKMRLPGKGAPSDAIRKDGWTYWGKKEEREKTEWLAKNGGDGLLVWDVNNDGKITSSKELFGNYDVDGKERFKDGYEKMAHYFDKNRDGRVEGDELRGLQIWKDANADGKVDAGEMQSLSQHGITSFDVKNINRGDMSSTFNKQTTTYHDVETQVLAGYSHYHTRELAGYQDQWAMLLMGGSWQQGGNWQQSGYSPYGGGGYWC